MEVWVYLYLKSKKKFSELEDFSKVRLRMSNFETFDKILNFLKIIVQICFSFMSHAHTCIILSYLCQVFTEKDINAIYIIMKTLYPSISHSIQPFFTRKKGDKVPVKSMSSFWFLIIYIYVIHKDILMIHMRHKCIKLLFCLFSLFFFTC